MRDWVVRDGSASALTERLAGVTSGAITIRHDPGTPALDRLTAIADGINLELSRQRSAPTPTVNPPIREIDRGDRER